MDPNEKAPNYATKYNCEKCAFICCKKSDWLRHNATRKHKILINPNYLGAADCELKHFSCIICSKVYKHASTLSAHKKSCKGINENSENILIAEYDMKSLILDLVKSNSDLQKQMIEVCKNSNNTINNNNSHNKTFNMQVFLNEKCKDAMNIMDFVSSMTLQLSDLEDVGELGYVEGISKIIIRKLNEMDVYKRPIHCSDYKREVMYVRDDNIWEKENSTYDKIRKAIKYITKKNGDLMIPWRDKHPSCMNTTHRLNDVYLRIMNQSMGGKGEFIDSENKIIKKLSKAVYIDKES